MNKKFLKAVLFKAIIFMALLLPFTDSMAYSDSAREKIGALKEKFEIPRADKQDDQDYCTVLIMLPTRYNPDEKGECRQIPLTDVQKTAVEIFEKFDQYSTIDPFPKIGLWKRSGIINDVIEEINVTLELDKVSMKKKDQLLKYCRDVLLERFKQEAIHVRIIPNKKHYDVMIVTK
ncbi:MAG TPA: hypothetical protein PKW98_01260 [Candidatus Wallbacteria bacterium]|nr:MAG: hypothetical protein BWY32_03044 [bacterium ADurb.Bin243]HOD39701.1 hypothetical protein [Candidatus Wallbacteria bacterium]HPG56418.1 hypothetical protein [Candidatus Wallbacteria bacterium]